MVQWFELETFMLKVSNSKSLTSKSKEFAFWVELVASNLPSASYLSYVIYELLHKSKNLPYPHPKDSDYRFPLLWKKVIIKEWDQEKLGEKHILHVSYKDDNCYYLEN